MLVSDRRRPDVYEGTSAGSEEITGNELEEGHVEIDVNLLDRLEQEHRDVEAIFARMEGASEESEQRSLVEELEGALTPHMQIEESHVYPVVAELDQDMATEAETEHDEARDALAELKEQIGQPGFSEALETLKSGIEHHVQEEEGETFPKLRQSAGGL